MSIDTPMTLNEAQYLYDKPAYVETVETENPTGADALKKLKADADNEAAGARSKALFNTALSVGVKAGLAWQINNIEKVIQRRARELDTIYDFGHLLIQDRVVPPVITEARDLYNQDGDYAFRLSGAYYTIENQARFSSVAPNWRAYLSFPESSVDRSSLISMFPRDDNEEEVWRLAVADGWKQGVEQANLMLEYGMDRMNRDFTGMIRFHTFVMEGKITMPAIAFDQIPVTKSGSTMAIDESIFRITTLPEFNGNMKTWSAGVTTSQEDSF